MAAAKPPEGPGAGGPFELDAPPPKPVAGRPPPAPESARVVAPSEGGVSPQMRSSGGPEGLIDERTWAEKHGQAVERVAGVRDYPPGWPTEALVYPVRGPGVALLLGATGALFALDLLGWPVGLRFLGWLLKIPVLLFVVRWQLDLAGMSAAGRDEPVGWTRALALDRQGMNVYVRFLLWFCVTMLPSSVLWILGPSVLGILPGTRALELLLLVLGSAWLAVIALAIAVEEPSLKRPWVTIVWLLRRPLSCLAGSLGWWGLGATEVALSALAGSGEGATIPAGVVLRAASVYALMVSGRVLGVLGRRVDPERTGPV